MLGGASGHKNTWRSHPWPPPQEVPLCVLLAEDPTTSRHRAVTSEMKNEKKDKGHSVRGHDTMFSIIPLRWQPHGNGDIPRKFLTLQVASLRFQHARWINKKRGQLLLASCENGQNHKRTLTSSHTVITLNSKLGVSARPSRSRHSFASCGPVGYQSEAHSSDMEFFVLKQTKSESGLPERHAQCHGQGHEIISHKKRSNLVLVQRARQIARVKKDNEIKCVTSAIKKCSIQCAGPRRYSTTATTPANRVDDRRKQK